MKHGFVAFFSLRTLRGKAGTARYLRGSVIGIALSLVPLLLVMEVSTGMIEGITARLLEVGTSHLQVTLPPGASPAGMEKLARTIVEDPDVIAAVPERQGTGLLVSRKSAAGVTIRCVAEDAFIRDTGLRSFAARRAGELSLARADSLLVSAALARTLGIGVGEELSVLTSFAEGMSGPPRVTSVTVTGIFETGYQELDKIMVYAPLSSAPRMLSPRGSRALIGVKVREPFADLEPIIRRLRAVIPADSRLATWRELEYSRLASFQTTRALLLFIMGLVVMVAAVNVSSSVLMIVFERRLDIGILKAVGASPSSLALAFLIAGAATGLLGTALGIALGLLVAVNVNQLISAIQAALNAGVWFASLVRNSFVPSAGALETVTLFNSAYYLQKIPIRIDAIEVVLAAAGTLLLSALASYIPAARAARVRPLEVLKKV
jgi:lipoprotein-releasing system permease protein